MCAVKNLSGYLRHFVSEFFDKQCLESIRAVTGQLFHERCFCKNLKKPGPDITPVICKRISEGQGVLGKDTVVGKDKQDQHRKDAQAEEREPGNQEYFTDAFPFRLREPVEKDT